MGNMDGRDSESEDEEQQIGALDELLQKYDTSNQNLLTQLDYQIQINIEAIRVPEIIFQPSIIGIEQMGIAEILKNIFSQFNTIDQQKLADCIFITGGNTLFKGIKERIHKEVRAIRPTKSSFNVTTAKDSLLDGWLGARHWANLDNSLNYFISRQQYEEYGWDYLIEYTQSNKYIKSLRSPEKKKHLD